MRMLTVFCLRTVPASSMANPACMKKTRKDPTSTQTVATSSCNSSCTAILPAAPELILSELRPGDECLIQ